MATVRCLGPFVSFRRGKPITKGWRTSAKGLLAYLIAHPKRISREEIESAIWPDVVEKRPHKLFNDSLHHIRKLFLDPEDRWAEKYVVREGDLVRLEHERWDIDAWRFESLIAASSSAPDESAISQLQEAIALYSGDFFETLDYPWIEVVRTKYRNLFVTAAARLAELLQETGDVDRALEVPTSATELEPLCEALYRRIITIHASAGKRSDAEAAYRRLARLLAQELGEEPDSETETLMQEIRKSPRGRPELVKEPL